MEFCFQLLDFDVPLIQLIAQSVLVGFKVVDLEILVPELSFHIIEFSPQRADGLERALVPVVEVRIADGLCEGMQTFSSARRRYLSSSWR